MSLVIGEIHETIARLRKEVRGATTDAQIKKAEYSTDASNYRVPPQVIVTPIDAIDIATTLSIAHETKTPVTLRGGGTSVAGNSIGTGIIIDTSVHMNKIIDLDK